MLRVITSTSAAARLADAARFLAQRAPSQEVVIVGASRGAADDLARSVARRAGATFGISRFSLTELAARAAASRLAAAGRAPATQAAAEAIAARVVFDAGAAGDLSYFEPVAATPGFPRALARTLHELRLARVSSAQLADVGTRGGGPAAADIGRLLARLEAALDHAALDDRAALLRAAADGWSSSDTRWAGLPLVLLDITIDSQAEREFVAAVLSRSPDTLATIPDGDQRAFDAYMSLGATVEPEPDPAPAASDLAHLRRYVFT